MVSRVGVLCFFLSVLLFSLFVHAQLPQSTSQLSAEIAALQGKVLNAEGRPASGIHVEIDDAATAIPITSTYTQPDGSFEVLNIPKGNYEVIAASDTSEVSDHVFLEPGRRSVELRFPSVRTSQIWPDATVSVARMLVPTTAQKLYRKAYLNLQKGKFADAEKQLDSALQIDPQFADAITLRAMLKLNDPNVTSARELLEQAIKADPGQSAAYITLAAIYNHEGRFDDAMRASEKGLSLSPKSWQAYLEMGKAAIAKSMYQSGLKMLRQAQRLGGNTYAEIHLLKAYALVPLKLYKDAKYELQASLSRQHDGAVAEQARSMLAQVNALETAGLPPTGE